jgi:putative transposase
VIAHTAVSEAGVSGSDVRDMMLAAVERRFGTDRAPIPVEHLSAAAIPPGIRATSPQLSASSPCFTPVRSPESNGMSEAFVKTLKRDYVRITPLPDARAVIGLVDGWISDYNTVHPHSALRMRSPAEFRAALNPG